MDGPSFYDIMHSAELLSRLPEDNYLNNQIRIKPREFLVAATQLGQFELINSILSTLNPLDLNESVHPLSVSIFIGNLDLGYNFLSYPANFTVLATAVHWALFRGATYFPFLLDRMDNAPDKLYPDNYEELVHLMNLALRHRPDFLPYFDKYLTPNLEGEEGFYFKDLLWQAQENVGFPELAEYIQNRRRMLFSKRANSPGSSPTSQYPRY